MKTAVGIIFCLIALSYLIGAEKSSKSPSTKGSDRIQKWLDSTKGSDDSNETDDTIDTMLSGSSKKTSSSRSSSRSSSSSSSKSSDRSSRKSDASSSVTSDDDDDSKSKRSSSRSVSSDGSTSKSSSSSKSDSSKRRSKDDDDSSRKRSSSRSSSKSESSDGSVSSKRSSSTSRSSSSSKTKSSDDGSVDMSSLQSLDFEELLNANNRKNNKMINEIMTKKYGINKKMVSIDGNSMQNYKVEDETISIGNLPLAKSLIDACGKTITRIHLGADSFDDKKGAQKLLNRISRKCPNLKDVDVPSNWSEFIEEPFGNAESAVFSGDVSNELDIDFNYPIMSHIRCNQVVSKNSAIRIAKFKNLTSVTYSYRGGADNFIENMFAKNPQIKSFEPRVHTSLGFMQRVLAKLTSLENLFWYPYKEQFTSEFKPKIESKSLKKLIVRLWEDFDLPFFPLELPNLQSLVYYQFDENVPFNKDWLKAITNKDNFEEFEAPETNIPVDDIEAMAKTYKNFKRVAFAYSKKESTFKLIQLLMKGTFDSVTITHVPRMSLDVLTMNLPASSNKNYEPETPSNGMGTLTLTKKKN